MDSLCLKILELNGLSVVEHEHRDGEADMDEQVSLVFASTSAVILLNCLSTLRVTGLIISFLEFTSLCLQDKSFFIRFCHSFAT